MAGAAKLDENYNVLLLLAAGVLIFLAAKSVIKAKKQQSGQAALTPISDAIASIKTGQVKVQQVPEKIQ